MIDCIMQLPLRMPIGTLLSCTHSLSSWNVPIEQQSSIISGRSIRVVPLTFYKVFSRWGQNRYEHTFITDEPFDSVYLTSYRSGVTKQIEHNNMSSVLYPISVKKITPYHVSTHLFTKSIDVLLRYYRNGEPLATIQPLLEPSQNGMRLSPECWEGVSSFAEYQKFIFNDVFVSAGKQYELSPQQQTVVSSLTPEKPEYINSCVDEIIYNGLNGDALFQYIDDMHLYQSGDHINPYEWLSEYIYDEWPLDPITLLCVLSPPHIILSNLFPYLGDLLSRISYNRMGFSYQNDPLFDNAVPIRFDNLDGLKLYELVEQLLSIPDTDFQIEMTWDTYVPHFTSIFGYGTKLANENIHNCCRLLFLDKWHKGNVGAVKAVLSKNWLDEVVVWCEHENGTQQVFYLSLAWFHLTSPSLINKSLFFKKY